MMLNFTYMSDEKETISTSEKNIEILFLRDRWERTIRMSLEGIPRHGRKRKSALVLTARMAAVNVSHLNKSKQRSKLIN